MSRRYADYEYSVNGHRVRVERYGDGWRYLIFWADGGMVAQSDEGDCSRLKRDAKQEGMDRAKKYASNPAA